MNMGAKLPVVMAAGELTDVIGMESADANFFKWVSKALSFR